MPFLLTVLDEEELHPQSLEPELVVPLPSPVVIFTVPPVIFTVVSADIPSSSAPIVTTPPSMIT